MLRYDQRQYPIHLKWAVRFKFDPCLFPGIVTTLNLTPDVAAKHAVVVLQHGGQKTGASNTSTCVEPKLKAQDSVR